MVGIADARLGERNCRCVIPKGGQAVTLTELVAHLKGQVADYKLPERLHIVDELPFTATGKLRRHVLRDMIAKGQIAARRKC
jgi:non-ribosomal peptide synthetase component E (peptide arylation enzyme)